MILCSALSGAGRTRLSFYVWLQHKISSQSSDFVLSINKVHQKSCKGRQLISKHYCTHRGCTGNQFTQRALLNTVPLEVNTNVVKDVILYHYDNPKFFRNLNFFALCQFGFWAYLTHFAYTSMKDAPVPKQDDSLPWWRKINLGEDKYKNFLASVFFLIGYGILAASWMYTLKSVRYVILRKGGKQVTFITYTPYGHNRMITADLNKVSSQESRQNARVHLPIKVKNFAFYYLLDMKGEFKNPSLFDLTVGLHRPMKKK